MGYRSVGEGTIYLKKGINKKDFENYCEKEHFGFNEIRSEKDEQPKLISYHITFCEWKCLGYGLSDDYWGGFRELIRFGDFDLFITAEDHEMFGQLRNVGEKLYCTFGKSEIIWNKNPTLMG
jgi:hypothetical protein